MPSRQYQHKSEDLWKQYQEGTIDSGTYSQSLEQIKNEEIATRAKRSFGILTPDDRDRLESDIWAYEYSQRDGREQVAQRKAEAERKKSLSLHWKNTKKTCLRQLHVIETSLIVIGALPIGFKLLLLLGLFW